MTRSELIETLSERFHQLTKNDVELAVMEMLNAMQSALAQGGRIEVRGFGSFALNYRPPREGRKPKNRCPRKRHGQICPALQAGQGITRAGEPESAGYCSGKMNVNEAPRYTLNRSVALLVFKQPFLDWLKGADANPELSSGWTPDELQQDNDAFLIPQFDDPRDSIHWVEKRWQMLFETILGDWDTENPYGQKTERSRCFASGSMFRFTPLCGTWPMSR